MRAGIPGQQFRLMLGMGTKNEWDSSIGLETHRDLVGPWATMIERACKKVGQSRALPE